MIFSVRGHSIWVLPSRQKINALQLAIAVGLDGQKMRRALKRLNITCLEYNRSPTKCATGTYVNFDDGLELWRDFGLEPCPLFYFMMDHQSPNSMPNSESRLTRRKGQDGELVSDREAQDGQDEEEDFRGRQFNRDFKADFKNEGREQDEQGELLDNRIEACRKRLPTMSSSFPPPQISQHSPSPVPRSQPGSSRPDRLSQHTVVGGKSHGVTDSFHDFTVLFPDANPSIVGRGR